MAFVVCLPCGIWGAVLFPFLHLLAPEFSQGIGTHLRKRLKFKLEILLGSKEITVIHRRKVFMINKSPLHYLRGYLRRCRKINFEKLSLIILNIKKTELKWKSSSDIRPSYTFCKQQLLRGKSSSSKVGPCLPGDRKAAADLNFLISLTFRVKWKSPGLEIGSRLLMRISRWEFFELRFVSSTLNLMIIRKVNKRVENRRIILLQEKYESFLNKATSEWLIRLLAIKKVNVEKKLMNEIF